MPDFDVQLEELRAEAGRLAGEIDEIVSAEEPTDEQVSTLDKLVADGAQVREWVTQVEETRAAHEKREQTIAEIRELAARPQNTERVADFPNVIRSQDSDLYEMRDHASASEVREQVKRAVGEDSILSADHKESLFKVRSEVQMGSDGHEVLPGDPKEIFDRDILRRGTKVYRDAFGKAMRGLQYTFTPEEADAFRSVNIGTAAAGAALTPTVLDPTVLLRNTGTVSPFRQISRNVSLVGSNVWGAISSAGVTVASLAEFAAATDDAPSFTNPTITCYKAGAFVPVSFEAFEDIEGLQSTIVEMIAEGKAEWEGTQFATGAGTSGPKGIVTVLAAATSVTVANISNHATNSVFTVTDLYSAFESLPPRYRSSASWVMNLAYLNRIRRFGSDYHTETVRLPEGSISQVLGRPAYESYAMTTGLNTLTNNAIVYGDFSRYAIVDRIGTQIEFIPQLFTGTNVSGGFAPPVGGRGWFAHWRGGADAVTTNSFILSRNLGVT